MKRTIVMMSVLSACVLPVRPLLAQQPAAAAPVTANGRMVVEEVRRLIRDHYVVPETRPLIDAALTKGLESGRYDGSDPTQLAARINEDLSSVSHDKHLGIQFDPQQARMIGTRLGDEATEGPGWERMAQLRNHGLSEMRVLDGNVRYLALDGFVWTGPKSAAAYDVAMTFLAEGDAAVIDLRNNGGGSPQAVQYVISHFMEPNRPLVAFHMGGAGQVDRVSTLASVPGASMIGKPLYVLTSSRSASAAEEFVGHVGGFGLGELVGETTAGAAYRNELFTVAGDYVLSVSIGRPELAATGGHWEGTGIAPTLAAPVEKALEVAHLHALRRLSQNAPPQEKAALQGRMTLLQAQLEPVAPAMPLSVYAGNYGERRISVEGDKLFFQRTGGIRSALIAIAPNQFVIEASPGTRIEFNPEGNAVRSFDMVRGDGSRLTADRTS